MQKILIILFALCSMSAAFAQNSPVILTVNAGDLLEGYWKAKEAFAKFESSKVNAQNEIQTMMNEGMQLSQKLQDLQAEAGSPAISEDRKREIAKEAQSQIGSIQQIEQKINKFRQETDRTLSQRYQSIVELHVSEIKEVVAEVAKSKGADLVLNSQGLAVVYGNESMDITDEVLAKLNADKP